MYTVTTCAEWSTDRVDKLIAELDDKHAKMFNYQEFILILKYIDTKSEVKLLNKAKNSIAGSKRSLTQISDEEIADAVT